jgi:hypothetical protein
MDIAEKRVYDDATGTIAVAIASETGLAVAAVSGDIVGEFGLALQRPIADLAVLPDGRLVCATSEDVLVLPVPDSTAAPAAVPEPIATDFGAAEVVSATDETLIAAGDGGIATIPSEAITDPDTTWTTHETATEAVSDADQELLATGAGVLQLREDGLSNLGLDDVTSIAASTPALAGTSEALYQMETGWQQVVDGNTAVVTAGCEQAHAVIDDRLHAFDGTEWTDVSWPAATLPVDLTYARQQEGDEPTMIAVTEAGTLLVDAGDGWRQRALGLQGVQACRVW